MSAELNYYRKLIRARGVKGEEVEPLVHKVMLIAEIKDIIQSNNWSQKEAAVKLRVKQPRIAEINRVCIDKFSTELLIRYLYRLQKVVEIVVHSPHREESRG